MTLSTSESPSRDKGRKIGGNAPWLFPVKGVSRARIHQEPRAWDSRREGLLIASRKDRILVSPYDKGGSPDLSEFPQGIVFQKSFERRSPHPGGCLQVLLHDGFEERLRHRADQRALRKLAHEVRGYRVRQLRDGRVPHLQYARFV